jgi:hypothetical protein
MLMLDEIVQLFLNRVIFSIIDGSTLGDLIMSAVIQGIVMKEEVAL